ncbi:unnamed protein product, partial [Adineta ricciae]
QLYDNVHPNDELKVHSSANIKTSKYRVYTRRNTTTNNNNDYSNDNERKTSGYSSNNGYINNNYNCQINKQTMDYAIGSHSTPLRIKCNPKLKDRNSTLPFVKEFFDRIKQSYKNKNSTHEEPLGFDYWWIDSEGDLVGTTKNLSLYVFLCDIRHYPEQINDIQLTPLLPTRLPPQHAIVIKNVPNDYSFTELEEELKKRYLSTYHVEEMNGTRRLQSRHIRIDIYEKNEYNTILNSGLITLGGLLCEVDEYLPAPKILICTRCNCPGHTKRTCRLDYERCRRCGNDRNDGEHVQCHVTCHHCGGDHQANDYKCPIMLQFRKDLIEQIRKNSNLLPPHIQMFIPFDCRKDKSEKVISNPINTSQNQNKQSMTYPRSDDEWPKLTSTTLNFDVKHQIKELQSELDNLKSIHKQEIEKINNKYQNISSNYQKTCLLIQMNNNTQKEIADTTISIIKDLTFNINIKLIHTMSSCIDLLSEKSTGKQIKEKIPMIKEDLKEHQNYISDRQSSFNNHMCNLERLWLIQTKFTSELMELHSPPNNNDQ